MAKGQRSRTCSWLERVQYLIFASHITFDSSVGRAVDCSWPTAEIHRSLVQIRLEGLTFFFCEVSCPLSGVVRARQQRFPPLLHFSGTGESFEMGKLYCSAPSPILDSLVVRISACHVEGPGSIPGRGENFSFWGQQPK